MTRALVLAAVLAFAGAASAAGPAAEISSIDGKGEMREAQQPAWRAAVVKQSLFPGNFVRTLDGSKMAIVFADRTQMRLSPNSQMQIKEVATAAGEKTVVDFRAGRGWMQSKTTPTGLTVQTPSALAAIRGTDWEIAVDDSGRATLSVFSGEVEFYNDQGRVLVAANEQASAEIGKAPVKLVVRTSRARVQWVSSYTVDPRRYGPPDPPEIAALVRDQRLGEAYERTRGRASAPDASAVALLLLADFEIYRGELAAASAALERASARFPQDERIDVALARLALFGDRPGDAIQRANQALAKKPDSVEALTALGDIQRHEGLANEAIAAYARAASVAARDPRPWYGIGVIEGERENVGRARSSLEAAIALDAGEASYHAELGTVEGFAGDLARGRVELQKAIDAQPGNYVALTGLGVLELRAGRTEEAARALLAASAIEPKYARAHLYLAAAYYRMERDKAALDELTRAAEVDQKDPLPHVLASIVHLDRIEPGQAAREAQAALDRMPFLKSLNAVADNQKGVANAGYPLAFMGLEAWARSAAQDSYLPFWGGSHLFLSDRYPGDFDKRSELIQGYVTDPLAFGASNRYQSLFLQPGSYGTISARYNHSSDGHFFEPVLTLNGYDASSIPLAYFAEAVDTRMQPGDVAFDARARTFTAAVGAKPTFELGTFGYANRLSVDADLGNRDSPGVFDHISGTVTRIDAGLRYAHGANSSTWLKAGWSDEDTTSDQVTSGFVSSVPVLSRLHFTTKPTANDFALRHTLVSTGWELTVGAEGSRQRMPNGLVRDALFHSSGLSVPQERLDEVDRDRSNLLYALARIGSGPLVADFGAAWRDYRKDRDIHVSRDLFPGQDAFVTEAYRRRKVDPVAGVVWKPGDGLLVRASCRRWVRPIALDTSMPVAVAGLPLDDQLVFSGGELEQCGAQAEWSLARDTFAAASVERVRVRNLVSPLDGVLNTRADVTNLQRLRNRASAPPPLPDLLEDTPVYGEGTVRRAIASIDQLVTERVAARLYYTYADSENSSALFPGRAIPYLARQQADIGLAWSPGWHTHLTVRAAYRTRRFADEANTVALPAGWDAQFDLFVESPDKRWSVEAYGANLLKKETADTFGIVLSYRF
jgi:Flp pilus assembly protein TadD